MKNPNEKLLNALKKFYEYKSKELREKYPLNQIVGFYLGRTVDSWAGETYFVLHHDGGYGISGSHDSITIRTRPEIENNLNKVYCLFYEKYKDIVKRLDELKKEEDALFRAVERMEARDVTQDDFYI